MDRFLLVGMAPNSNPNFKPYWALFPFPPHLTGGRLCEFMGLHYREHLPMFRRRNLLDFYPGSKWPVAAARTAAENHPLTGPTLLVGAAVRDACELEAPACTLTVDLVGWIPHTSPRSRWWKDPANRAVGEKFLRESVVTIARGMMV